MWSGGKDSCLAVWRVIKSGMNVSTFICMLNESNASRAHGLYRNSLVRQTEAIGINTVFGTSTWKGYEMEFRRIVSELNPEAVVFGDIYLEEHRIWLERVCNELGVKPLFPLWGDKTIKLAKEFISEGFEAYIVAVRRDLSDDILGKRFDDEIVDTLVSRGIDPCGEDGEFHTYVVDGPLFKERVTFNFGKKVVRDKYIQLEVL
jgi:uncharacterized protein (TIGR00290 family)